MTFEEAGQAYSQLRAQLQAGQITPAQFTEAAGQLRLQDASGNWWQIDPNSGHWLYWNGSNWVPGGEAATQVHRPQPAAQVQARPPLPQARPAVPAKSTATDKVPVGIAPVGWGQIVWDIITLAGCAVMAALWYWYSGMAETAPDTKSCVTMVALPLLLMVTRRWTDRLLLKLQPHIVKIPRMVLLGLGLAIPFLVANQLYGRYTEFEYLFRTLVVSTIMTYILFRAPMVRTTGTGGTPPAGGKR